MYIVVFWHSICACSLMYLYLYMYMYMYMNFILILNFVHQHMNSQSPSLSPASSMKEDLSKTSKEPYSPSAVTTSYQSEERELTPPPQSADEEWVEYVDSFGRTRSCLRKDLPEFTRIDQQLEAKKQERRREKNRSVCNAMSCIMVLVITATINVNKLCSMFSKISNLQRVRLASAYIIFQAPLFQCFIQGEGDIPQVAHPHKRFG